MKIREIKEKIRLLKINFKKIVTNFYPGILNDEQDTEFYKNEKALVFVVQEANRKRAFFAFAEKDALSELLLQIPAETVIEFIYKQEQNPLKMVFENGNMRKYATYMRKTICYSDNPFSIPETGRRKLLEQMYDPDCGVYAKEEDAVDLYELTRATFDILCDDVFTLDQWRKIIEKKECLLYREDGEIIAFYVYRLEGKKLYSNLSVNKGSANYLYNLERRVFEEMWERGIRIYYGWFNTKNNKALMRKNENKHKAVKSEEIIFNDIYIK